MPVNAAFPLAIEARERGVQLRPKRMAPASLLKKKPGAI